ncbi:MAG: type II toxin-antitoxin system RelE/ParE family toxin [Bacilli bacterium]|nr:type II toxin-antitoxin system RelE/ParE family toxin [Bacilli bacterium]
MKHYEVLISPPALMQAKEIARYIAEDLANPIAAGRFLARFRESVMKLDTFPEACPLLEEDPWREKGVRKMMLKSFVAYFHVDAERLQVIVLAILYAGRNQLRRLETLDFDILL